MCEHVCVTQYIELSRLYHHTRFERIGLQMFEYMPTIKDSERKRTDSETKRKTLRQTRRQRERERPNLAKRIGLRIIVWSHTCHCLFGVSICTKQALNC